MAKETLFTSYRGRDGPADGRTEDASLGSNTLSDQELSRFRNEIVNFMHGYDDKITRVPMILNIL